MRMLKDYAGRSVRLAHILGHAEMAGMEGAIEETVRDPQLVIQSRTDPTALLSHRYYYSTRVGDKWLCVVVKYNGGDALVVTAYLTDKPKKGLQVWPRA